MRSKFNLLLFLCHLVIAMHAQNTLVASIDIGAPAPPLKVHDWIKGKPIDGFVKGKVYVIEFWATWCGTCIEEMPRLTSLAHKYKNSVTVIGVNIYERKTPLLVKAFVDSMAHWMDYVVATQDSNYMEKEWMDAARESTIPTAFVVDAEGRLAWIGYTARLPAVLPEILANKWDLDKAAAIRHMDKYSEKLGYETFHTVNRYISNRYMTDFFGEPDSALLFINKIVANNPDVKFERLMAFSTLHALLRTDAHKAYEYGRAMLSYKNSSYDAIISSIEDYPYKYNSLPKEIFELGAEACQAEIDHYPWSTKTSENYYKMAEWYLHANNRLKAKHAMRLAIKTLKRKKAKFLERSI